VILDQRQSEFTIKQIWLKVTGKFKKLNAALDIDLAKKGNYSAPTLALSASPCRHRACPHKPARHLDLRLPKAGVIDCEEDAIWNGGHGQRLCTCQNKLSTVFYRKR
jgi:hypothetical protein